MMTINKGVYTPICIDLSDKDFTDIEKFILTIKNDVDGEPIITKEFEEAKEYTIFITPEEASTLTHKAVYDFDAVLRDSGYRIKYSENKSISVVKGVGDVSDA